MAESSGNRGQRSWWLLGVGALALLAFGFGVGFMIGNNGTQDDTEALSTTATVATTTTVTVTTTTAAPTTTTTQATTTTTQATTTTTQATTTTTTPSIEEALQDMLDLFIEAMEASEYERVEVAYFDNEGIMVMEAKQVWASKGRQENVHWETVQLFASILGQLEYRNLDFLFGGDPIVHLTTVSTGGEYRYQSWTNHDSMVAIEGRRMGLDAWKAASDAGFQ